MTLICNKYDTYKHCDLICIDAYFIWTKNIYYIVSENPIRVLEKQSGLIRLLIFLLDHQPINVQSVIESTDIYPNIMYASLKKSKDLGLITTRTDSRSYPPRSMISLTDKGRKVAKHLKEIEEILGGE